MSLVYRLLGPSDQGKPVSPEGGIAVLVSNYVNEIADTCFSFQQTLESLVMKLNIIDYSKLLLILLLP